MSKLRPFLNNKEISDPINLSEVEIQINWNPETRSKNISTTSFELGTDNVKKINQLVNNSIGVIEGVPFSLKLDNENGTIQNIFNGYLDLWGAEYTRDTITANAIELNGLDWLNDVSDSVSFEYLWTIGKLNNSHIVNVPYCINKPFQAVEIILCTISLFIIRDKIEYKIVQLQQMGAEATNPFEGTVIARAVLELLYIIGMLIVLTGLIIQLYNYLIQPVKYHTAMYVTKQLEIGLEHFGLKLQSSILQQYPFNEMLLLPEKFVLNANFIQKGLYGNETISQVNGFYNGTFGELLRQMKQLFNAQIIVENGTLYFEKQGFNISNPTYIIPNLLDSERQYRYNKDDFNSNFTLSFAYDLQDKNTIQQWKGTNIQVIQNAIAVNNAKMNLAKQIKSISVPFALGKYKTELNTIENIFNVFYKVVGTVLDVLIYTCNAIIKLINAIIKVINKLIKALKFIGIKIGFQIPKIPLVPKTNLTNKIENRIGMLVMENDNIVVPKLLLLNDKNNVFLNAEYIYNNFWNTQSFVDGKNQYLIKKADKIPFTATDYNKILNSNLCYNSDGKVCQLLQLNYNPIQETANIEYRVKYEYLKNVKETIILPDGK